MGPAVRRADATWLGCAIAAAVLFGPTGLHAADVTRLAIYDPELGLILGATWLLVFLPTARCLLRAEAGAYLRSLPGAPWGARAITIAALFALQLPWLALWVVGDGARGLAVVMATTAVTVALAAWRPAPRPVRTPIWTSGDAALRATHLRAIARRAGDAIMRGAGLAILAGVVAGLPVRNNELSGESAAVLGAALCGVTLLPARLGVSLVTLGAHRDTAWLAASTGISPRARLAALLYALGAVNVLATALGVAAAMAICGAQPLLAVTGLGVALTTTLYEARAVLLAESSPSAPSRVVTGAIVGVALAVVCLALLDAPGVLASSAIAGVALAKAAP